MLHHDDGIAEVTQFLEGTDETVVVPLVQSDTRFVEDIQHVHQLRADLCGKTDALTLTARQGCRLAVEGKVVESHLQQEVESGTYLLQYLRGYLLLLVVHVLFHLIQPFPKLVEVHGGKFRDVLVPDTVRQSFAMEPLPMAFRTLTLSKKLVSPFLSAAAVIILHDVTQIFHDTVERHEVVTRRMYQFLVYAYRLQRAVENLIQRLLRDILDGSLYRTFIFLEDSVYLPEYHLVLVFSQGDDGTLVDRQFTVWDDLLQVYLVDIAQALTAGTGTLRGVEREGVRSRVAV